MDTLIILLFLIGCIGIVVSIILLIKNKIKKQDNKKNKKILIGFITLTVISFIVAPVVSSQRSTQTNTFESEKDNKSLTEEDKELLKKHYKDFNVEQRTQFVKIKDKYKAMNDTDKNSIKTDFERLCKEREIQFEEWDKEDRKKAAEEKKETEVEKKDEVNKEIEQLPRENIIGTSNKNFKELSNQKPRNVRNDTTGNWRITTIANNCDIKDYALSYYNENFGNDSEIHAIVNFTNNTTTKISNMGNFIEVVVLQRIDKEEHDAKKLFGGMKLAHYWIYKNNGEIEKVK